MIGSIAGFVLRLYPRTWRMRYEEEVRALLEEHPPGLRDLAGLVRHAAYEWQCAWLDPEVHPFAAATVAQMWGDFGRILAIQLVGVWGSRWLAERSGPGPASLQIVSDLVVVALILRIALVIDWASFAGARPRRWLQPLGVLEFRIWFALLVGAVVLGHWSAEPAGEPAVRIWQYWMFQIFALSASTEAAWSRRQARSAWIVVRDEHREAVKGYLSVAKLVAAGRATREELDDLGRDVAKVNEKLTRVSKIYRSSGLNRLPPHRPLGLS